jgi:hypothetical protein
MKLRTLFIALAAMIAFPLYLMVGGGLFAYSAVTSLDQRGGVDASASRSSGCLNGSETGSLQRSKKATIKLYSSCASMAPARSLPSLTT